MTENSRQVAVIVGATSKWQADGRNTRLVHGRAVDDSELPPEKELLEHIPVEMLETAQHLSSRGPFLVV